MLNWRHRCVQNIPKLRHFLIDLQSKRVDPEEIQANYFIILANVEHLRPFDHSRSRPSSKWLARIIHEGYRLARMSTEFLAFCHVTGTNPSATVEPVL
jgi:hypothetical protein